MTASREDRLDQLHIPSPCSKRWEELEGGERSRFCSTCALHVHDLAAHTREEADSLLARREQGERVCVRVQVDEQGQPITAESAPPARPARARGAALALALGASLLAACRETADAPTPPATEPGPDLSDQVDFGPVGDPGEGEPLTTELRERLELLGYVAEPEADPAATGPGGECDAPSGEAPGAARETIGSPGPPRRP